MTKTVHLCHSLVLSVALVIAAATTGCASASGPTRSDPETTGTIVAKLTKVPADVECVALFTNPYGYGPPTSFTTVVPGKGVSIRIVGLNAGYLPLAGDAFSAPCADIADAGLHSFEDFGEGGTSLQLSWVADPQFILVVAGQTTATDLHFHQPGAVNVGVAFDNCVFPPCGDAAAGDAAPE
jgi:hypothetical protein